jgi:hypothetical protein
MKKYFLGLSAIVCAIAFSAFTKPYTNKVFKLLTEPISANIVNNDEQWSVDGFLTYGRCDVAQNDIACTITLNETQTAYYNFDGDKFVLNTEAYATSQNPKQKFLAITEATGLEVSPGVFDRIISSIQPKEYDPTANGGAGGYVNAASLGADLSFNNARD